MVAKARPAITPPMPDGPIIIPLPDSDWVGTLQTCVPGTILSTDIATVVEKEELANDLDMSPESSWVQLMRATYEYYADSFYSTYSEIGTTGIRRWTGRLSVIVWMFTLTDVTNHHYFWVWPFDTATGEYISGLGNDWDLAQANEPENILRAEREACFWSVIKENTSPDLTFPNLIPPPAFIRNLRYNLRAPPILPVTPLPPR